MYVNHVKLLIVKIVWKITPPHVTNVLPEKLFSENSPNPIYAKLIARLQVQQKSPFTKKKWYV